VTIFGSGLALGSFSNIVMGAALLSGSAATGVAVPAGAVLAVFGANALLGKAHDARKSDAKRILTKFRKQIIANWQDWVPDDSYGDENRRAHAIASFDEVLPRIQLSAQEVAGQRMDAGRIADLMLAKAAELMPATYGSSDPNDLDAALARRFLHDLSKNAYAYMIGLPEFTQSLAPAIWQDLQAQLDNLDSRVTQDLAQQNSRLEALENLLVASLQATGQDGAALGSGVSEKALIQLAQRIATDVQDPAQAIKELEYAVDLAVTVQRNAASGAGTDDPVLDRVGHLSADGAFSEAADTLEQALAHEEAAHLARSTQLLNAAIEQDILRRDPVAGAGHILRLLDAQAGGRARFEDLSQTYMEWFVKARDRGLWIDFRIGEELARLMQTRAETSFQQGRTRNFLGVMCHMRGERISGSAALLAAIAAFEEAQTFWPQSDFADDWAKAQMNLANSLHALAQRDPGNDRIERAIAAYDTALQARHKDEDPFSWAQIQMNRCTALRTQAELTGDLSVALKSLEGAEAALAIRTREANGDAWATALLNRGMCKRLVGQIRAEENGLLQAQADLNQAIEYWQDDPESYFLSMAQQQLGLCAYTLWPMTRRPQDLMTALHHFDLALVGLGEERSPVDRLMTKGHHGLAHAALALATNDTSAHISAIRQVGEICDTLENTGHLRGARVLREGASAINPHGTAERGSAIPALSHIDTRDR